MKTHLMAGSAALVLTLAACGGGGGNNASGGNAVTPPPGNVAAGNTTAPTGTDWTQQIAETELGFRMGNPDAPVKLVEYASITCPHCGQFSTEGGAEGIQNYVRTGQVSWEYRPYMIFPTDPGLFALLRCQGAGSYFQLAEQLYADQQNWALRAQNYMTANRAAVEAMDLPTRARALVRESGADAFFRQRGMTQGQIDSCLADTRNLQRVADDTQRAIQQDNPPGTPTFIINGEQQPNIGTWAQLDALLRARVGG
jgi:protein-disulfide isomerase